VDILKAIYNFPGLEIHDIEKIIQCHSFYEIQKNDFLLKKGQIAQYYWIVRSGLLRSYVIDSDGQEVTTGFYGPQDLVVEVASLFRQMPTQEYIHAIIDTEVYGIAFEDFQQLFLTIPRFAEWGRAWMTEALSEQKSRMINMITQTAQERYLQLMEEKPLLIQNAPLKYIASYLGITDTSLSRIRKELSK